jgi:hypothetical protein
VYRYTKGGGNTMIRTEGTTRKLDKVFTGSGKECRQLINEINVFDRRHVKECTRGNNLIAYFRPDQGRTVNDKIWMIHWNKDGTVSLYL